MKKITLILALAVVALSSCSKNRTCNCITSNVGGISNQTSQDIILEDVSKKEGTDNCDKLDNVWVQQGLTATIECTLIN